jgi:hypothetical protein
MFPDIIHRPVFILFTTHNVSETGFCLRLHVKPTQLGTMDLKIDISSIDWAQLSRVLPEDGDRIQSPKRFVLNKNRNTDNVQKHNKRMDLREIWY